MRKFFFLLLFWTTAGHAQFVDTLTVMTYNLLYYGVNTSFCTTGNNNVATKNGHLQTIFQHTKPDVLGVQEMGAVSYSVGLLQNVLNTNGITSWSRAPYTNTNASSLVSLLYYNTDKLTFQRHDPVPTAGRDIILYRLYYNTIPLNNDTIFLNFAVMHLKAGGTSSDQAQRGQEAQTLMDFLNNQGFKGNLVIMGDLNVSSSSESGYQHFVTHPNNAIRLYDPVNRPGNWSANSSFADIHTQAPTINSNGCTSGGGMDDRYDHLLINDYVRQDSGRVAYVAGSYLAVGNDGIRYNGAVNSPSNQQVPVPVANALAVASDHLPVRLKLAIDLSGDVSVRGLKNTQTALRFAVADEELLIWSEQPFSGEFRLVVRDLAGRLVLQRAITLSEGQSQGIPVDFIAKGVYVVSWTDGKSQAGSGRFIRP